MYGEVVDICILVGKAKLGLKGCRRCVVDITGFGGSLKRSTASIVNSSKIPSHCLKHQRHQNYTLNYLKVL